MRFCCGPDIGGSAGTQFRVGPESAARSRCHSCVVATHSERPGHTLAARVTAASSIAFGAVSLVVIGVFDARFRAAGRDEFQQFAGADLAWLTALLASAAVGALLLVRRPRHPIGWLFAALGATIALV